MKKPDIQKLINAARDANIQALTRLSDFMLTRQIENPNTWREQGIEPGGVRFFSLQEKRDMATTIWHPLSEALINFAQEIFSAEILWMSFSLEVIPEIGEKAFGLDNTIVLHSSTSIKKFEFQFTLTRRFIEIRQAGQGEPGGIGICATQHAPRKSGNLIKELHFLHTERRGFVSQSQKDSYQEGIDAVNKEIRTQTKWSTYIKAYQPLVSKGSKIEAHISATAFYNPAEIIVRGIEKSNHPVPQAVAQVVVGLSIAPTNTENATLFYQLLQICIGGIPPLYSSLFRMTREIRRLEAHQERMKLVEEPLSRISRAMSEMQSEVQELRAVLYDPARALFQSHRELSELFTERGTAKLSHSVSVELKHKQNDYDCSASIGRGRAILATALCRIFGSVTELNAAANESEVVAFAKIALGRIEKLRSAESQFLALCANIRWLCDAEQKTTFEDILNSNRPGHALARIKMALFDPYKVDSNEWSTLPFNLAARCFSGNPSELNEPRRKIIDVTSFSNPTTCHHVIELLMGVASAAAEPNPVSAFQVDTDDSTFLKIICDFNTRILEDSEGTQELANHIFEYILSAPRDWRVEHQLAGNWRKPFVDFASRVLGLETKWEPYPPTKIGDEHIIMHLKHKKHLAFFSVSVRQSERGNASSLVIEWRNAKGSKSKNAGITLSTDESNRRSEVPIYLLDHHYKGAATLWKNALSAAGIISPGFALRELPPMEFLAHSQYRNSHAVFLHAASPKARKDWNTVVERDDYNGCLIHISAGEPHGLGPFTGANERIHICEYGPKDFSAGELASFIESCRNGSPNWQLLRRSNAPAPTAKDVFGPRRWKNGAPSVVVAASDHWIADEVNGSELGVISDAELQYQIASPTCHATLVKVVVLAHAEGESESALIYRYNAIRRWLQVASDKQEVHSVSCLIWTLQPDAVRKIVVAHDGSVKWTFGKIEQEQLGLQVLDASRGVRNLRKIINDPVSLPAACDLQRQDRVFCSDVLRNNLALLVCASDDGRRKAFQTLALGVRKRLRVQGVRPMLEAYCVGDTGMARHCSATSFVTHLASVTPDVTQQKMRTIVAQLSRATLKS